MEDEEKSVEIIAKDHEVPSGKGRRKRHDYKNGRNSFLVYHKEYEEFLNSLRELGVVHIVEKQQGAADNTELQENIRLSNRLTATLKLLQNQKHEKML